MFCDLLASFVGCMWSFPCAAGSSVLVKVLCNGPLRMALTVGCALMMFQQIAGINTVM